MSNSKLLLFRSLRVVGAGLACMMLFSSCVYYRFYRLKGQLSDFEKNFRIEQHEGPTIVFLKPVIRPDDVVWLVGLFPSVITPDGEGSILTYTLRKVREGRSDQIEADDIEVHFTIQSNLITSIELPGRFREFITQRNFEEIFSPMRDAKIQKVSQQTSWSWRNLNIQIPDLHSIKRFLGSPSRSLETADGLKIYQDFQLDHHVASVGAEAEAEMEMRFELWPETTVMKTCEVRVGYFWLYVDLSKEENFVNVKRRVDSR